LCSKAAVARALVFNTGRKAFAMGAFY